MSRALVPRKSASPQFDAIIIGGGIMGCTTALWLARRGHRVAIIERHHLGMGATGVNAGTLSIQNKPLALLDYALESALLWQESAGWLGSAAGYSRPGGLCLAFTPEEAEQLSRVMAEKRALGLPVEILDSSALRAREPLIGGQAILGSWCPIDSYANAYELGMAFRRALSSAGVAVHEHRGVTGLERAGDNAGGTTYQVLCGEGAETATLEGRQLIVTAGLQTTEILGRIFGVSLPLKLRANQLFVTERTRSLSIRHILSAIGKPLTLKQSANGTILIGGGWDGDLRQEGQVDFNQGNYINNLRLAVTALPRLNEARLVRSWIGLDGSAEDGMPVMGRIPGWPDCFALAAVRGGGFTVGPALTRHFVQMILGESAFPEPFSLERLTG